MLPIQALKFERLFNRVIDLTIYRKDYNKFLADLLKLQVKDRSTGLAFQAWCAARRARSEGRLKIVDPGSSVD